MAKPPLSHYSPKFANKAWSDHEGCISYFRCDHSNELKKLFKGWKQWGRRRGLYSWPVEKSLSQELETFAGPIYEKIINYKELSEDERIIWAQFLLSQLVRTPTYIKYENKARELSGIIEEPEHCRVGCKESLDLNFVVNRDWCLLQAHHDDFFLRSDNPVLQTGFIWLPETSLFYPLTPKLCFVACSMSKDWDAFGYKPKETCGYMLQKGDAHMLNFYLAKSAEQSLIIPQKYDGDLVEKMFRDVLGVYPQPPFSLHIPSDNSPQIAFESIRKIMSYTDGIDYPIWKIDDLVPFYR